MSNKKLTCPGCNYSHNPLIARECKNCGMSLEAVSANGVAVNTKKIQKNSSKAIATTKKSKRFVLLGLAIGLGIGTIGSLILPERNEIRVQRQSLLNRRETESGNLPQSQSIAQDNSQSEIQASAAEVDNVPEGLFWYGSSIPFAPLHTTEIVQELNRAFPGFKTQYKEPPAYTKPGSSTSVAMLLDGVVSFAELSRPLKDSEYEIARIRSITLQQIPIASDGIVFFVHPALPVDRLTINQVRKMILGEITNWQEVGGPDLPVVPFVFDPKIAPSTLLLLFREPELERFSEDAQYVRDYTDGIRKVSATPGGISYASAAIIANQRSVEPLMLARGNSSDYVNPFTEGTLGEKPRKINTEDLQNGHYPLLRRFFIGVRRDGTIDELAGLAYANIWLTELGQKLIEKAGFVPIKTFERTASYNPILSLSEFKE